jgi:hypothetical protein
MKDIQININKARIQNFSVELCDEGVDVFASIGLFMGEKKISDFSISTKSYANNNFTLDPTMVKSINIIAKQLENIVVQKCNEKLCLLEPVRDCI